MTTKKKYRAVDCQAFAGAFSLGTVQAGFELAGKVEADGGFGVPNLLANRDLLPGDWEVQVGAPASWEAPGGTVDYLFSNPPCSGFSRLTTHVATGVDSRLNSCMWDTMDYAGKLGGPPVVVMESVPRAGREGRVLMQDLRDYLEDLTDADYDMYHVFMSNPTLGNPQQRPRYFLVLTREGLPFGIDSPPPVDVPTYETALADLMGLKVDQWEPQAYRRKRTLSDFAASLRSPSGRVDSHSRGGDMKFVRQLEELWAGMKPGKQFSNDHEVQEEYLRRYGRSTNSWSITRSVRVVPESRVRVVTGAGTSQLLHWAEPRVLTVREASRLMGFPDDWTWKGAQQVSRMRPESIAWSWSGKQVTVDAGRWISSWVKRALDGKPGGWRGEPAEYGEREWVIDVTEDYRLYNERLAWKDDKRMDALRARVESRPA